MVIYHFLGTVIIADLKSISYYPNFCMPLSVFFFFKYCLFFSLVSRHLVLSPGICNYFYSMLYFTCENLQKPWMTTALSWENLISFWQSRIQSKTEPDQLSEGLKPVLNHFSFSTRLSCSPWGVSIENLWCRDPIFLCQSWAPHLSIYFIFTLLGVEFRPNRLCIITGHFPPLISCVMLILT